MAPSTTSSGLLAALERCWAAIQATHPELPDVVMLLGAGADGRRIPTAGYFLEARWVAHQARRAEVMIAGELFAGGGAVIMGELLHEAAHAIAHARRVPDTSQFGNYHNKYFARVAGELGLRVEHEKNFGWHNTAMLPETVERYAAPIADIEAVQRASRQLHRAGPDPRSSRKAGDDQPKRARLFRVALVCACPRRITAAPGVLGLGEILCGACKSPFAATHEKEPSK